MEAKSNKPKLNPIQTYLVARALNDSMKEFYKDSQNQAKFEDWKKRKEELNGQVNGADSSGD